MNAQDRIPIVTRLLRPGYAREVAFLVGEHRRSGIGPLPADVRGELELHCETGARTVAERRVARRARSLRRMVDAGQRRLRRARTTVAALAGADGELVGLDGRAVTLADLRARSVLLGAAVDVDPRARRLDRASRPMRFVGHGLLLVDAVALLVVLGFLVNLDWLRPDPAGLVTAVALSLFGAAVQGVLALHLGRRLWAWRHTDLSDDSPPEFPPRAAVVVLAGGFLAVISTFAAGAIYLRVQGDGVAAPGIATALGLLLGASALAAPWCLVADEAYGVGPEVRLLRVAGRLLVRADRCRLRRERRARRHLDAAAGRLRRAEWALASTVHRVGRDYLAAHRTLLAARGLAWGTTVCSAAQLLALREVPDATGARAVLPMLVAGDHRCLTLPVEQLRSALARGRADYVTVVERLGPDELDLAG